MAKSVAVPDSENPAIANSGSELPSAIIDNLSAADLKSRMNNPMPKKSLMRSVDKKKLNSSIKNRKRMKQLKKDKLAKERMSRNDDTKVSNKTKKKQRKKFLKQPLTDNLDSIIAKRVAKSTV